MAHTVQNKSQPNLLEGPLFGKIVLFVLPLILTNLLQRLYNAADMIIVGMSGVDGALGAIGTTGAMINLVLNLFMGLAAGTNVVVARWIGAGDRAETERAVHTSLVVSVIFGVACGILGLLISRPLLIFLGDEGHILELAVLYCYIYFAGVPFVAVMNFAICIFRAKGDTKTPMYILSASGVLNVVLNLVFVVFCRMHVDGVAWATVISNAIAAAVLVWMLLKEDSWCRVTPRKLKLHKNSFGEILRIGVPSGLQSMMFSLSNMVIQSSVITVNSMHCPGGSAVIDGIAAADNLETFIYTAQNSVHHGAVTFTSQHYGAGKIKRIRKVMVNCTIVAVMISLLFGLFIKLLQKPLLGLYISDSMAMQEAMVRHGVTLFAYAFCSLMEVVTGVLRGMGRSAICAIVTFFGVCIFRVAWNLLVFPLWPTMTCIFLSYPISWLLTTAICFFICMHTLKKEQQKHTT